ncbi:phospholipase D family protein (plasmid) [Methylocystis sp. MJC1]|uniref:phospholipase D family protein n=1 Tax=Methylocystis sp. MJC1 TaxID=2654282 RepID=UPI0013EA27D0|nr:phospholipase D family protein [Methylocystis sp. MJC1]KAF2991447.1 hypothetical protein MJC1_01435 [Methylocystis sp. MJC1]MBU6529439.1 phospholipase D family protein [Methylocystis sp. MJC1]UZX14310.1 phospholipase D family protein [Methylocystis sp. MJC1]
MYVQEWHIQHKASGAIGETLQGVSSLLKLRGYRRFRAAVAYASINGCKILNQEASGSGRWAASQKRWLISIDFGRTEPEALEFLANLPHSQVRIPNGKSVVQNPGFSPANPFHPKAYVVDDVNDGDSSVFGIFLGSGNLTGSGLLTGSECGALSYWNRPKSHEQSAMMSAYRSMTWFDPAWDQADPLSDIIPTYKSRWKKFKPPLKDESAEIVDLFVGGAGHVIAGRKAIGLAFARKLWVEIIGELYKNRGASEAGNQVDLPRGSRVFFGFTPKTVPKNTVFGHVELQNVGFPSVECSVRFGNNMMDKINLPIPGTEGPASYDNSILLFERHGFSPAGMPRFRLVLGDEALLTKWKKASISFEDLKMQSGRRFGLMY